MLSKFARLSSAMVSSGKAPFQGVLVPFAAPLLVVSDLVVIAFSSSIRGCSWQCAPPNDARWYIAMQHHAAMQYSGVAPAVKVSIHDKFIGSRAPLPGGLGCGNVAPAPP